MDRGIWATWYDLPGKGREEYLAWLHEAHLPGVLARKGYLWAAHFGNAGGGERFQRVIQDMARADDPAVGAGKGYLVLLGAGSSLAFFDPNRDQIRARQTAEEREMLGRRIGAYTCVFAEEYRVEGPEAGRRAPGVTPGPYIQMGNFNVKALGDGHDLGGWYAQHRLPFMAKMKGGIGARKLAATVGWGRHSILYEYLSAEAREEEFVGHEEIGHEAGSWTSRVHQYVVHAPCSPFVGPRLWPPFPAGG
ncbi:MAG: hypothetical protein A3I72_07630 [Candidatus Tectomicrobia bacterium RIFCSPLOWO2_02_FULL_70_19]|nr:MAG: hypothetical protein A3I72_07630 [Candidatus Tectomicrobia bacterium RIFCSPLOWO2_02_FULL_70_19]